MTETYAFALADPLAGMNIFVRDSVMEPILGRPQKRTGCGNVAGIGTIQQRSGRP